MSKDTKIEWADSTLNLQMGCDGCELWNRKAGVKNCYAGTMTDLYGGHNKGWPKRFEEPELFVDRLDGAIKWGDLTGKERPNKPWLNGLPRIIFLNDLGDTFTESLPIDWLAPYLPRMEASPHQWLLLTKRPSRMVDFSKEHPLPPNVWPGTSVTSDRTSRRLDLLRSVVGGGPRWCSGEPLLTGVDFSKWLNVELDRDGRTWRPKTKWCEDATLDWLILGGTSGQGTVTHRTDLRWIREPVKQCLDVTIPVFVKQLGSNAGTEFMEERQAGLTGWRKLPQSDAKGGDWNEWPDEFRVRQMPALARSESEAV